MPSTELFTITLALLGIQLAFADPVTPKRSWDTLQSMAQFHGSNESGPFTDEAIQWIGANFVAATVEKWQDLSRRPTSEEANIIATFRRLKAVNPAIVTAMYNNLICHFPQYTELYATLAKDSATWLSIDGTEVVQNCAGFQPGPVPDWRAPSTMYAWQDWAANISSSPDVDGFFFDRIDDTHDRSGGVKNFSNLPSDQQTAFIDGKWNTARNISKSAFVIAGDGERIPGFHAAFIQTCEAGKSCLTRMSNCVKNDVLCFVHVDGSEADLATFLIGATDKSYIVKGGWHSTTAFGDKFIADHTMPEWKLPLGAPIGPAAVNGTVYTRAFTSGTTVWLDTKTAKGTVTWRNSSTPRTQAPQPLSFR